MPIDISLIKSDIVLRGKIDAEDAIDLVVLLRIGIVITSVFSSIVSGEARVHFVVFRERHYRREERLSKVFWV